MNKSFAPSAILVLIGLALIFHAVQANPLGSSEAMSVRGAHEEDVGEIQQELNYAELSPEGQDAFTRGLKSGMVRFDTWEEPPPDFDYVDVTYRYLVRYQGEFYVVASWGVGGFPLLRLGVWIFLVSSGSLLALLGLVSYRRGWFRTPVSVLVALFFFALSLIIDIYGFSPNFSLPVILAKIALVTLIPAILAWFVVGKYVSDIDEQAG